MIAQETLNAVHLAICKERIPKEFKKKEKKQKRLLSERYRIQSKINFPNAAISFKLEKDKVNLEKPQLASFILRKRNRVGSTSSMIDSEPLTSAVNGTIPSNT